MTREFIPRRRDALLALGAALVLPAVAHADGAPALPTDSVYRLDAALVDQEGRAFTPASLRGEPVLASMFYTSCDMVCPMVFETLHATLRALPAVERVRMRMLMVSVDPARDSVAVLKKTAAAHGCDDRWLLARADEGTTRKLAAVLGIQYRRLSNGEFNHSTVVDVLDGSGRIAARTGKLGQVDPAVTAAVHRILQA